MPAHTLVLKGHTALLWVGLPPCSCFGHQLDDYVYINERILTCCSGVGLNFSISYAIEDHLNTSSNLYNQL